MKKERASFMAPLTNQHIVCACYAPAQEGTKKENKSPQGCLDTPS